MCILAESVSFSPYFRNINVTMTRHITRQVVDRHVIGDFIRLGNRTNVRKSLRPVNAITYPTVTKPWYDTGFLARVTSLSQGSLIDVEL